MSRTASPRSTIARRLATRSGGLPNGHRQSRGGLVAAGKAVCLTIAFVLASATVWAEDWPRWRGPRGDGTWNGPRLPPVWPATGLATEWKKPIGGGYAGLAVSEGRLYTQDKQIEPTEQERVLCFDAATGQLLWQHAYDVQYGKLDYGSGPRATPTIFDGRVYTLGAVGHVHCLDAQTGEVLWRHDLVRDFGAILQEWGLAASPVIWQDLVILHPGLKRGGCFVAFDRRTGREMWRASDDTAGYCTPILTGDGETQQLIGWTPQHVLGINPSNGQIHWSVPYKVTYGVSIATPIVHRGVAFVTGYWEGSKAIKLGDRPTDARLLWEDNDLQGIMCQPLARDGYLYTLDKDRGLICCELQTGRVAWTDDHQMTSRGRNPHAVLQWLGDSDRALILNAEGDLILARLTPQGYDEQSRTHIVSPAPAPIWAHPAFAGESVFSRNDGEIIRTRLMVEP